MGCRYAGIDWASEAHDVLVADEAGGELLSATYAPRREGPGRVVSDAGAAGVGAKTSDSGLMSSVGLGRRLFGL